MKLLALDLSLTAIGWARNTDLLEECGVYAPRGREVPRLQDVLGWVLPMARGEAVPRCRIPQGAPADVVLIEGYSFNSEFSHAHALGELGGVVKLGLAQVPVPVVVVPPASLKKFASGKGNARKDAVLAEAIRRLGYEGSDHNAADARWLLAMALTHYELPGAPKLPAPHLEALAKVQWPDMTALRRTA